MQAKQNSVLYCKQTFELAKNIFNDKIEIYIKTEKLQFQIKMDNELMESDRMNFQ